MVIAWTHFFELSVTIRGRENARSAVEIVTLCVIFGDTFFELALVEK